jgi:predicted amidophosphoribosyltransferase
VSGAALQAVCDLALPRACAGCGAAGCTLCAQCRDALDAADRSAAFAARPDPCPAGYPPTWSQTTYDGTVARLLRVFKDAGRRDAGPALGRLLRGALAAVVAGDPACRDALLAGEQVLVCPMPSRPASIRGRGREPAVELARHAVRDARPFAVHRLLRVTGNGTDQAGLGAAERSVNVRGTMRLTGSGRRLVTGRVCVVVDDIVTTGSSLVEARKALVAGGAREVTAATVAATQRHTAPRPFTGTGSVV